MTTSGSPGADSRICRERFERTRVARMLSTTGDRFDRSGADEPFQAYFETPLAGGALAVASSGPQAAGTPVALALHGMTGTHMVFRTLARELGALPGPVRLPAPDLRGRGTSAQLPPPYGMDAHVDDLVAVLDHAGVDRAIVIGHSMGCNVAARLAADHPERCSAVLLLDSGVPLVSETVVWGDGTEDTEPHGIFDRFDVYLRQRGGVPARLARAPRAQGGTGRRHRGVRPPGFRRGRQRRALCRQSRRCVHRRQRPPLPPPDVEGRHACARPLSGSCARSAACTTIIR